MVTLLYLLVLLSSYKAVTSCTDPRIRFRILLNQTGSNNLKRVSLHCWLEGHQVMNSIHESEGSLNAQLYFKQNGTIIDPFKTSLMWYNYSILDEQNISASYYISQDHSFDSEFSCVHNSTAKSSDLVFVYYVYSGTTFPDTVSIETIATTPDSMPTTYSYTTTDAETIGVTSTLVPVAGYLHTYGITNIVITTSTIAVLLMLMLTFTCLILVIRENHHYKREHKVCSEVTYKTCPNYDLTLRSPIESPPQLEMRLPSITQEPNSYDATFSDSGAYVLSGVHHKVTYPKICSNYSKASPDLYVKFVDPVETIKFDCNGGSYSDENNEVYLRVPKGAIPKGKIISIQVGVSFHSALVPLLPRKVRPVSPLVKLCVMEEVDFKFLKPVRVTLPHSLDVADEEDAKQMGLQFMKCGHGLRCFHQSDGEASFNPKSNTATLRTTHFCTFCITANQRICSSKVNYRLVKVIPKNRQESMWRVNFCVTYYLKTCLQVLKKQFPDSSFEMKTLRRFKFSASGALEIHFERRLASGWQLALEKGGTIFPKDVQYMDIDPEELEMMEEDGVYPPRFEVQVCGSHAREPVNALICFRGMADTVGNDTTELLLEPVAFAASSGSFSSPYHMWQLGGSEPTISAPPQKGPKSLSGPSHSDLMNYVAAALPTKWRIVGVQLGLSLPRLDEIERNHSDCKRCFSAVFSEWEQQETSPFRWETVVSVLQTPSVEENRVAEEVKTHFMRRRHTT